MGEGLRWAHLAVFKQKIQVDEQGCWIWQGPLDKDGYGIATRMFIEGKEVKRAHRIAFYLAKGFLPPLLDHVVCDNRACCNPDHMEPSTDEKNTLRGKGPTAKNAKKTHCPKGHPYDGKIVIKGRTWRRCNTCRRERRSQAHKTQ